jgi:seryl-tRNA synthetase
MIDIRLIRENPNLIKTNQKKRGLDKKIVDEFLKIDNSWRKIKKNIDNLRAERNKISLEISKQKKKGGKADDLIKKAKRIPGEISKKQAEIQKISEKRIEILKNLPNIIDKSVPVGGISKNKVLKKYKTPKKRKIKGHAEIMEKADLINTKKAGEVAGSRFYYLKNELVNLNHALMDFALGFLSKKNFDLIQPPYMLKKEILESAITLDSFEEAIYKIEGEDLYLIGTAEHALNAYYINELIPADKLPVRLAGISPCFRKEAGAHGKDTKGIFRVHQFEKIEQFVFCKPENSWKEFDLILKNSIEMYKQLGIPFRVVVLSSEDTGKVSTKTIDLEGWFPSQNCYRELGSCSNCLDYQARKGNIRFQQAGEFKFVHTLNNTAIATERMMTCLVENNLQKNGTIKIPKALWKYTGFKSIKPKKGK